MENDKDDCKSTISFVFFVKGILVLRSLKKEQVVAFSTCETEQVIVVMCACEAEHVIVVMCACQAEWLDKLLIKLS